MVDIEIRQLNKLEEFRDIERLQLEIWNFSELEVTPLTELVVIDETGGAIFGAFDGDRMIGFLFGQAGYVDEAPVLASRMLGVLPAYRNRGVGTKLKWAQADAARSAGIYHVIWTFDPLQGRNAWFNLVRLGAVVRRYYVNRYGDFSSSPFNLGLATDRFHAEWFLHSQRVRRAAGAEAPGLFDDWKRVPSVLECDGDGNPVPVGVEDSEQTVRVEIPSIMPIDAASRASWRIAVREALAPRLDAGWWVDAFSRMDEDRSAYRLSRNRPQDLPPETLRA